MANKNERQKKETLFLSIITLFFFTAAFIIYYASNPLLTATYAGETESTGEPMPDSQNSSYPTNGYFKAFNSIEGVSIEKITCLTFSNQSETLFAGSYDCGVFALKKDAVVKFITEPLPPSAKILSICYNAADDSLAIGTNNGLLIAANPKCGKTSYAYIINTGNGATDNTIRCLSAAGDGTLYVGTDNGIFCVKSKTVTASALYYLNVDMTIGKVNSIFADDNGVYFGNDTMIFKTRDFKKFDVEAKTIRGLTKIGKIKTTEGISNNSSEINLPSGMAFASSYGITISNGFNELKIINKDCGLCDDWASCFASDSPGENNATSLDINQSLLSNEFAEPVNETDKKTLSDALESLKSDTIKVIKKGDKITINASNKKELYANDAFRKINEKYKLINTAGKATDSTGTQLKNSSLESVAGGLWIGTKNHGVCVFNGNDFITFNTDNSPLTSNLITDILCTKDYVYISTIGGGILRYGKYEQSSSGLDIEQIFNQKFNFVKTIGNDVYAGGPKGLFQYNVQDAKPTTEIMFGCTDLLNINDICTDSYGAVYVASDPGGTVILVNKFKNPYTQKYEYRYMKTIKKKDGAPSNSANCVSFIEGHGVIAGYKETSGKISEKCILISTDHKVFAFQPIKDVKLSEYDLTNSSSSKISAITAFNGGFFIGISEGEFNALAFNSGSCWSYVNTPSDCAQSRINSIKRSSKGKIYVAGNSGVGVFDGKAWMRLPAAADVPVGDSACALPDTMSDGVWILQKSGVAPGEKPRCALTYSGSSDIDAKIIDGEGIDLTQLDPYLYVATTTGVYKVKK